MSTWYRAHHANAPQMVFSGEGGLYVAGRWHHMGRKVIYCSDSISLCTLEWLSHNGLAVSDFSYNKYSISINDELIKKFTQEDLPTQWRKTPPLTSTKDFAEEHLFNQNQFLAIAVPSVVIPEEYNLVMNPLHTEFSHAYESIKCLGKYDAPKR